MNLTRTKLLIIILTILTVSLIVSFYWLYSLYGTSGLYAGLLIYMLAVGCILILFREFRSYKIKCKICGSVMRPHEHKKDVYVCNHCNKEIKIDSFM